MLSLVRRRTAIDEEVRLELRLLPLSQEKVDAEDSEVGERARGLYLEWPN